jgi:hypothetical protein
MHIGDVPAHHFAMCMHMSFPKKTVHVHAKKSMRMTDVPEHWSTAVPAHRSGACTV